MKSTASGAHPRIVIVPAAGLGTRLYPLTYETPKEMLPLGGRPALTGAFLEMEHANIDQVVVVLSPGKESLRDWIAEAPLTQAGRVCVVEQPEPLGVTDAVARARVQRDANPYAVLFPDYVHVAGQRALDQLWQAYPRCGGTLFGLVEITEDNISRLGPTSCVRTEALGDGLHRIHSLGPGAERRPGQLHTTFAEIRGANYTTALTQLQREGLGDSVVTQVLQRLAAEGTLFGRVLDGEILDLGCRAGYDDAVARFEAGRARWATGDVAN